MPLPTADRFRMLFSLLSAICFAFHVADARAQSQALTIDVPAITISGSITVDGSPPPVISEETGFIDMDGVSGPGSGFRPGRTADPSYGPTLVIPSTYRPIYSNIDGIGVTHPINPRVPIGPSIELTASGPFDIDVPTVVVFFDLTLDGGVFGTIFSDRAEFSLRHVETGDTFRVGSTDSLPFGARIVPGVYDLLYHYDTGAFFPKNSNAVIAASLDLSSPQTVTVDVASARHFPEVDLNGGAWPASLTAYGFLSLESLDGTDRVEFGTTTQDPLPGLYMIQGSYVLVYEWANGGIDVPLNTRAIVDDSVTVARTDPPNLVSVSYTNIEASVLSWDATIDGSPFPTAQTAFGQIVAVDADGHSTLLGPTISLPLAPALVEGTYDLYYQWQNGGVDVPRNTNARIDSGRVVSGPTSASVDVPLVVVEIDPRFDGATFSTSLTAYGSLELEGSDPGDRFPIGLTTQAPLTVSVIPGGYDVIYTAENGETLVPANRGARVAVDLPLTSNGTTLVDIETTAVTPDLTLDGQPFPTGTDDVAEIFLRSERLGEVRLIRSSWPFYPTWPIVNGVYEIEYKYLSGSQIPETASEVIGIAYLPEPGASIGLLAGLTLLTHLSRKRVGLGTRS